MLEQEDYGENGTIKITDYTKAFTIAKVVEETLELKPEAEEQHVILKEEKNIIDVPLGMNYETLNKLLKLGTLVYRTDEKGNILIESDGIQNKVSFY